MYLTRAAISYQAAMLKATSRNAETCTKIKTKKLSKKWTRDIHIKEKNNPVC